MTPFERSRNRCSYIHEIQVMAAERVPEPWINFLMCVHVRVYMC